MRRVFAVLALASIPLSSALAAPAARSPAKGAPAPVVAPPPAPPPAPPIAAPAPAPAATKPGAPSGKTRLAVMDVAPIQGVTPGTATILTSIVVADVAKAGLDTISRAEIASIIGFEKQRQVLGCSQDAGCIAEIGGALGVDFMLTGQVGQIGSQYHLSLQLVDSRKARVTARASRFCEKTEDALVKVTREAAAEVIVPALALGARPSLAAKPGPGLAPASGVAAAAPRRGPAWIAFGVGGALAVAGAATGYVARSKYDDLKAKQGSPGYEATYASEKGSIRSTALAADVMLGGAIAAAGVGTWLWFRTERPVAVVPVVAPGAAALAVVSTF